MDGGMNCNHDFEPIRTREFQIKYGGHRRRCRLCLREEIWRIKEEPGPDNAPELGKWEKAPDWRHIDIELGFV